MPPRLTTFVMIGSLLAGAATVPTRLTASDPVVAVRDLYEAAAYREALDLLERPAPPALPSASRVLLEHYRALCLIALQRDGEGVEAFERALQQDPLFDPGAGNLSPRVRQLFLETRRRVLPGMAQAQYAEAREAWEARRYGEAAAGFARVQQIVQAAAGDDPVQELTDLRLLARGFEDLAREHERAALIKAQPAAPVSTPAPRRVAAPTSVVPPVTITQAVPAWPSQLPRRGSPVGFLEVLIDEKGRVAQATMRQSLNPLYDELLMAAARQWRYEPARRNGEPTPYLKTVRVEVR